MKYGTRSVYYSAQQLGKTMLEHGRARLHLGERTSIRFEWGHGKTAGGSFALMLYLAGGDSGRELSFRVGVPFLCGYFLTCDSSAFARWMPHQLMWFQNVQRYVRIPVKRQIGVRFFDWILWVSLWEKSMEWNKSDPKWWSFRVNVPDVLLGREKQLEKTVIDEGHDVITMPEADYPYDYAVVRSVFKRPRWKRRVTVRVEMELSTPIPVPGKGENDWDMGDDAIYSITFGDGVTVQQALARLREDTMRDRVKYGGPEWAPAAPLCEGWDTGAGR